MKKIITAVLCLVLAAGLTACAQKEHKVVIADDRPIVNELKESYAPGEEVTIVLETITEQDYVLTANGANVAIDLGASDICYSYFTFSMPNKDVLLVIEERSVDIPEAPAE